MRTRTSTSLFSVALVLLAAGALQAETKVTLSHLHLCCGKCTKAVDKAVASVDGASVAINKKGGSATITASSDAAAQKAVDAIAAAGLHGHSNNAAIAMKGTSVKAGKVSRIEFTGVHNCCGGCNKAIQKAISSVAGADANTAKPKSSSIVVEGNFDAQAVAKALFHAGFHVTAKK